MCRKFIGKVVILLAFVNTEEDGNAADPQMQKENENVKKSEWTDDAREEVLKVSRSSIQIMKDEAARYGVDLDLTYRILDFSVPVSSYRDGTWYHYILENLYKTGSMDVIQQRYRRSLPADSAPVVFLFNDNDTSHTYIKTSSWYTNDEEYSVIFCDMEMHDNYLTHEILHQYGAIDYYNRKHIGIQAVAEKYFPDSLMLKISHNIDDLTAFLIGWTDTLSDDARSFLKETEGL